MESLFFDAEDAIEESARGHRTTTCQFSQSNFDVLLFASSDNCEMEDGTVYFGVDDEGDEWKVLLVPEEEI
jgi:hypothetical protein